MLLMRKILFLAFRKGVVYAFPSWDLYRQEHIDVYVDRVRFWIIKISKVTLMP